MTRTIFKGSSVLRYPNFCFLLITVGKLHFLESRLKCPKTGSKKLRTLEFFEKNYFLMDAFLVKLVLALLNNTGKNFLLLKNSIKSCHF